MNIPHSLDSFPTLQCLCATVVVKKTRPDISLCNGFICNTLLDHCVKSNQLRMFRLLLEAWPHEEARLNLKANTLHYIQSLAILEHQGVVSKVLRRVFVSAPYAGSCIAFEIHWPSFLKSQNIVKFLEDHFVISWRCEINL